MKADLENSIQENVKTLLESLAEGVVIINARGQIIFVNSRVKALFGYEKDELIGQQLNVLLPNRYKNLHNDHVREYFSNPRIRPMGQGMELAGTKKDGTEFYLEISLSFIEAKEGKLGFAFLSDITERKKAQDELRERNKELDSFAHTVAHDINSTLAGMIGFGDLLVKYPDLPEEKKKIYYERIVSSGKKMSSIIRELLFFASIKKEEVVKGNVIMDEIIQEALSRLETRIKERNAEIILSGYLEGVESYGPWVEEIWLNLISNAIKYGGNPPKVEIGFERQKKHIRYWVKDNGKGLTREEIETILEDNVKFKREEIKGHGLGLSIVHRILKKLDGFLEVNSKPGKGSTFSFYLPR